MEGDELEDDELEVVEGSSLLSTATGRGRAPAKLMPFSVDQDIDLSSSGLQDLVSDSKDSHHEVIEDTDDDTSDTPSLKTAIKRKRSELDWDW